MGDIIVKSQADFKHYMKNRKKGHVLDRVQKDKSVKANHSQLASQTIKVVNALNIEPFIKKVMTLRLLGPIITGQERSHKSIAIELGAFERDVIQAEEAGQAAVYAALGKVSTKDFMEKYNRERSVDNAIKTEIGKTIVKA